MFHPFIYSKALVRNQNTWRKVFIHPLSLVKCITLFFGEFSSSHFLVYLQQTQQVIIINSFNLILEMDFWKFYLNKIMRNFLQLFCFNKKRIRKEMDEDSLFCRGIIFRDTSPLA